MLPDVPVEMIPHYYYGDLEDFTNEYLEGKLGEVVDKITTRFGSLVKARLDNGSLPDRLYEATVVRIAARVFANPEGYRKENEGGYGYELNPAVASGTIWFTDEDIHDLTGIDPKGGGGIVGTATIGRHRPGWRP
ncbi:hypothetical protein [Microbacterium sp. No. 7]|uniref:hypothetical protein n=1 Tax=Microbacterium sp. No. 7 TaxID=1714373 RepID=UPI0006D14005|nr:hypothetical protein [Microbacterium sp. No. 7]ALJ22046.1 hypothetical protein AOA12_19980 [Microbacterium sp. No. 7]